MSDGYYHTADFSFPQSIKLGSTSPPETRNRENVRGPRNEKGGSVYRF